ncbi:MAG: MBL fold metallo-hydrolase [Deltaproteobacteria bacterium]|nr:MBL fold metallo-hydrolase [Deltaproteobacteria bacterium]
MMHKTYIKIWGARGALATPGRGTVGVGGNTSCLEVRCGRDLVILDAGTGIEPLGQHLERQGQPIRATILFSHFHLDHTVGLPFFRPLRNKKNHIVLAGPKLTMGSFRQAITFPFRPPSFPVTLATFPARMQYRTISLRPFQIGRIRVVPFLLHHPGGSFGYRLNFPHGRSIVYATDNEPKSAAHARKLTRWMAGADLLIHDGQYTPKEYASRKGWGHSPYPFPIETAAAAGVPRVLLCHHSPSHNDRAMKKFLREAQRYIRWHDLKVRCELAVEGQSIRI